ncbi:unnamed protein product [Linum tenue]|uniref:Fucosyltransferase n=1 Tax=Linum tenue TaxID=586396 RepID=A0AAV0KK75_9ROSI|nr:unnamed protein product [Linum tenue]
MTDLFREPFPNSTWLLPRQDSTRVFDDATTLHFRDAHNYIHYLLYLPYRCRNYEKFFFRDENQKRIESVPWLILHSDQYFLPYLFLMPCFRPELDRLFPNRETVFHQLGRYLFSPSHQAWGFISTFYETFLSKADERIGIQIRVFNDSRGKPTPLVMQHVLSCIRKQGILNRTGNRAVLVASLSGDFYRELKVNATGVGVYQASQEESQRLGDASHNMKAWVDMYLLSMCDVLLTSAWSTFGYVAHGLGGVKPWILQIPDIGGAGDGGEAECRRAVSAEPCFHNPPDFDCPEGFVSPVVRCEDVGKGMKLVNQHYS